MDNVFLAHFGLGEGWHNYHHTFPWDYKTGEFGNVNGNFTAAFINFFAKFGWAYDLKTVPKSMIEKRARRTGDGSHPCARQCNTFVGDGKDEFNHITDVWGWDDKDMSPHDIRDANVLNKH